MPPTTRTRSPGAANDGTSATTPERMTYVLKAGYLEVLAGDDPALRNPRTHAPMPTTICIAAGLDRGTFHDLWRGNATLTPVIQGSLVALLQRRGYSEPAAREALFEHVTVSEAAARIREPVPV